jgi:hypothetical protein
MRRSPDIDMSLLEQISKSGPISNPSSLLKHLPLEDAYWMFCTERACDFYGHTFSDHGQKYYLLELGTERRWNRRGLEFKLELLFEYEHRLGIDDPGFGGSVYVKIPSRLSFNGSLLLSENHWTLDYTISVVATGIQGLLVNTEWGELGDQAEHSLLVETLHGGSISKDACLLEDMIPTIDAISSEFDYG